MPRLTQVLSTVAFSLGVSTTQGMFRFDCHNNLVVDRADPIINFGTEGTHVHVVSGGNAFSKDATDLTKSTCTSCPIGADLSAYWTPALYVKFKNGTGYARVKSGQIVYYEQRGDKDEKLYAFPPGLKMVAGNVNLRTYNESDIHQKAITWQCINYDKGIPEQASLPNVRCPQGLRGQVNFPMCWDGKNLDSPDHKSHVAYAEGIEGGKCPPTHPKKFIKLFYEMFFEVAEWDNEWDGDKHPFVLANGDTTGYSFHGDFFAGWDEKVLQDAVDQCADKNYFNPAECTPLTPTYKAQPPEKRCIISQSVPEEVDHVKQIPMGSMIPVPAPTTTPTDAPSTAPSSAPGPSPTTTPSTAPSSAPSTPPSSAPSTSPSSTPRTSPSSAPTPSPSKKPTKTPQHTPLHTPKNTNKAPIKPTTPQPASSSEIGNEGDTGGAYGYDSTDGSDDDDDDSTEPTTKPSKCKTKYV